uniref:Pseudouridylate synthase PUS7L n=1 Tax=Paramormyrops kingsleyae TaxID=1676925 RepID=A0A3B3QJK1_9TELE|nr:pseudouridylate synthase 7 homolog-like protein [Paramormyrops kingsleyae]
MDQVEITCSSVSCFISNHEGFQGSIKHFTSDFVVTEINIDGQMVYAESLAKSHSEPLLCSGNRQRGRNCEPKTDQTEGSALTDSSREERASQQGATDHAFSACVNMWEQHHDLEQILGRSANDELEKFAMENSLCYNHNAGENPGREHISLGTFPDKHQRANVHRAVRHTFPHLMTITTKNEITVKQNPDYKELSCLVSEEESQDFFRFIDAKVPDSVFTFKSDDNKEHRKAVHHLLSKRFGKLVEAKSFTGVNSGEMRGATVKVRFRERKRTAADCVEEDIVYTAFVLKKENLETLEAISYMAASLGVLSSDFTYAGIKDKRAITYQSMVVKKIPPERLREKCPDFEKRGICLSSIHPVSQPLSLGRLWGNHFDLVVRDLRPHCTDLRSDLAQLVDEAVDNIKINGFVNYYGPQRFGTSQTVQSDRVGLALLKQDVVMAIRLFFTPEDGGGDPSNRAKRHFLETGNAKESLALMPEQKPRERLLLRALHRYGPGQDGCTRAWLSLPHGMRVFYTHAYCSRLWNEAATYRLRQLGRHVVQGDLVWEDRERGEGGKQSARRIHVVSAVEAVDGVYSLRQVVLPMPGNTVKYPENIVGDWYQERLASDELQDCRFRVVPLKLNLPGCYRPLLAYPQNLTHKLQGHSTSLQTQDYSDHTTAPNLTLSFDLDSSCYATVCLWEIMKCEL